MEGAVRGYCFGFCPAQNLDEFAFARQPMKCPWQPSAVDVVAGSLVAGEILYSQHPHILPHNV
jgi:hypothetical protein